MSKRKFNFRTKIITIATFCLALFMIFALNAKAETPSTTIVASDIETNNLLHQEMIVYKAADADPNWDYYFVKLVMIEKYADWDIYDEIWIKETYFYCSTPGAQALETFMRPQPGYSFWDTGISVSYYGVGIGLWLPAGVTSFWYENDNPRYPNWRTDAAMGGWGTIPVTRRQADNSIAFRVPDGSTFKVAGNNYAVWYKWYVFVAVRSNYGWGAQCYCSYNPP